MKHLLLVLALTSLVGCAGSLGHVSVVEFTGGLNPAGSSFVKAELNTCAGLRKIPYVDSAVAMLCGVVEPLSVPSVP